MGPEDGGTLSTGDMHVVALRHALPRDGDRPRIDEAVVRELARAAAVTPYELGMRLRVLDGAPGVLATFAGRAPAEATAAALRAGGVQAWVLPGLVEHPTALVRRFSLEDGRLRVELDGRGELELPVGDVRMLLHCVHYRDAPTPRSVPLRFNAGSWAMPMLGLTVVQPAPRPSPEPFVYAFAPGTPTLAFHAAKLQYGALQEAIAPTRAVNFRRVVQRLRQGCPDARYDDRLRRLPAQTRLLGPTLRPERYLELAIALVVGGRVAPRSPYR